MRVAAVSMDRKSRWHDLPGNLRHGAGEFDARRARAHDDEREQATSRGGIHLPFRRLERE
jgi:hypothetical protein